MRLRQWGQVSKAQLDVTIELQTGVCIEQYKVTLRPATSTKAVMEGMAGPSFTNHVLSRPRLLASPPFVQHATPFEWPSFRILDDDISRCSTKRGLIRPGAKPWHTYKLTMVDRCTENFRQASHLTLIQRLIGPTQNEQICKWDIFESNQHCIRSLEPWILGPRSWLISWRRH